MKTRILTFLTLLIAGSAFAQFPHPDYHFPTPVQSSDGMNGTCVALIYIDGVRVETEAELEVAFFDSEGVCRQRDFVHNWGDPYGYQFQSVVFGEAGTTTTFKFYNHTTQKSSDELGYVCTTSFVYQPNCEFGILTNPEHVYFFKPLTCTFTNVSDNNWSTAANWEPRIPVACDDAIINGACIADEDALDDEETLPFASLTILDGGQFDPNGLELTATFVKNIDAYTPGTRNNYYFIANPTDGEFLETENLLTGDFDLYFFDQLGLDDPDAEEPVAREWQNYKDPMYAAGTEYTFSAEFGGYLYANATSKTLKFSGIVNGTDDAVIGALTVDNDAENFPGFNLVGNPLPCNASVAPSQASTNITGFYTLNNNGSEVIGVESPIVAPCSAIFAVTTKNNTANRKKIKFTANMDGTVNTRDITNLINIEVSNSESLLDRAYVRFNEQENLQKFTMNADATHIYFREDGKDFAIVQGNERMSQLPLYFETKEYGEYTINVKMENMNCEYLHLIDNMTGANIDLNATPSYTFTAHQGDYKSRFILVFEGTGVEENESMVNFAIVEGNRVIIPEAQGRLDVIDLTGRTIMSENVKGSFDQNLNLSNGIYMLRLNGKVQKIVVR